MKKQIKGWISVLLCCLILSACGDGSTTMDGGLDTDGRAGESSHASGMTGNPTSGENGEGAQGAAENIIDGTENAVDQATDAVDRAAEGVGDAAKKMVR